MATVYGEHGATYGAWGILYGDETIIETMFSHPFGILESNGRTESYLESNGRTQSFLVETVS